MRDDTRRLFGEHAAELGLPPATARAYGAGVSDLESFLSARGLELLGAGHGDVSDWVDDMLLRLAVPTARLYLAGARSFLRWSSGWSGLPDPTSGISIADPAASASAMSGKPSLTPAQVAAVLAGLSSRPRSEAALRDLAIARLLMLCAVRPGEAVAASAGDFSPGLTWGVLDCGGQPVAVDPQTSSLLRAYLLERAAGPSDPLLASVAPRNPGGRMSVRSVNRVMASALEPIGASPGSVSMVKTAMAMAVEAGADAREARELARMRSGYSARAAAEEADARAGGLHEMVALALGGAERGAVTAGELRRMLDGFGDGDLVTVDIGPDGRPRIWGATGARRGDA